MRTGQRTGEACAYAKLCFEQDLADCRDLDVTALFAVFLARYSQSAEPVSSVYQDGQWAAIAQSVDLAQPLSAVAEIELPEPTTEESVGLAVGLCFDTIDVSAVIAAKLDFVLYIERGAQTRLCCYYNTGHFEEIGAKYRLHAFATLLDSIQRTPDLPTGELKFSSDMDQQLLDSVNNLSCPMELGTPIHKQFEEQVLKTPDAEAVRYDGRALSYRELDERSNQLAHYLNAKGAGCGVSVGVFVERTERLIISLLAVLKSGSYYIPLDPGYPAARIAYIVSDSKAPLIVTEESLLAQLDSAQTTPVVIDQLQEELSQEPTTALSAGVLPEDPMYCIYTSGSTGNPKGVEITHRNAAVFVGAMISMPPLNHVDRTIATTTISFDISVAEIYCTLMVGGCIVMADRATITNPVALAELIEREQVETMHAAPSLWRLLLETGWKNSRMRAITGGEAFPREMIVPVLNSAKELWNFYGPTEATVFATGYQLQASDSFVTIGKPLSSYTLHVCDERGAQVPFGAAGELWIGGPGVSNGYTNREDLNITQFPVVDGKRYYRTGDSVRMLEDGSVEYFCRLDGQVKINGYRIELGEIEAVLSEHPSIARCVVDIRESDDGDKALVAWCLLESGTEMEPAVLKAHLAERLTSYMVPSIWTVLDEVPINPNGKVDRKALPAVEFAAVTAPKPVQQMQQVATDELERYSRELWLQTLGVDSCDEKASFFDLGGTSMMALQFVKRVNTATGSDHGIVDFFSNPNLQAWIQHVRAAAAPTAVSESVSSRQNSTAQDIAIVGMAVHVPGAQGLREYWQNILDGVESISHFDREELLKNLSAELVDDPDYVPARGVLEDYDAFDNGFFSVNPREALAIDPQQRLFLQTAWHAFEDAGQIAGEFDGQVGVYAGTYTNSYHTNNVAAHEDLLDSLGSVQEMIAREKDYVATRVAHKLNLKGPAISVHTACSTSLVAISQACDALRLGHCDMAVAGAASVDAPSASGHLFQEGGVFCKDGHTKSFSADATGTMFSDGVGAVVLKRVDDAVANGDRVYAVIKGTAVNNDGAEKMSFMAPSSDGQAAVIEAALRNSGVPADTIGYLEAHGTATPVGDPIEIEGLRRAYAKFTDKREYCAIGSVKSNVGHLTAAAGGQFVLRSGESEYSL